MRIVTLTTWLASVCGTYAKELAINYSSDAKNSMDELVDSLADKFFSLLFDQVAKADTLEDFNLTTLGRPGLSVAPGRMILKPPVPLHARYIAGRDRSPVHQPQQGVVAARSHPTKAVIARSVTQADEKIDIKFPAHDGKVRVRFAPSPTGNLHVGGARTALFNWLYARNNNGKFILRVEDTDTARSTRASEEAMVRDLKWLGLDWDEGPDVGGEYGPYRQSERTSIYRQIVDKLVAEGYAYPCFCTDEELTKMKEEGHAKYVGKWKSASPEEVQEMFDKGAPHTYRFRVPEGARIEITDLVRGKVGWDTETLGDFVLLRSTGIPVYNFCVVVDDAMMGISHVLRAEEHLANTLRQVLIYNALKITPPQFAHISLILAPDKTKLSKRHGATSVGQFRELGYLPKAMVNYLALLGWNEGTDQEIYEKEELVDKFSVDRVVKSSAVFDNSKLKWMNGQHIRTLPEAEAAKLIGEALVAGGLASDTSGTFVTTASMLVLNRIELVEDAVPEVAAILGFPLAENIASGDITKVLEDDFGEIVDAVVARHESGELKAAVAEGKFQNLVKEIGKALGRKGKRLFMPVRVALTARMQGPDVGDVLALLSIAEEGGAAADKLVSLDARIEALKAQASAWAKG